MGYVIPWPYHGRTKSKATVLTDRSRRHIASLTTKKYRAEMEPLPFHRLTMDGETPISSARDLVPPIAATISATVVSMASYTLQNAKLSTVRNLDIVNSHVATYTREMARGSMAIAKRLELLQKALKVERQKDMAALAGVSEGNWSQFMSGEREISRPAASRLKDATGVTLDWLYDGDTAGLPFALANKLRQSAA